MKKLTKEESLLKQLGKKGCIKVSALDRQKRISIAKDLENKGLIKRRKKDKKSDPAVYILTEKGRQEYENKFQK